MTDTTWKPAPHQPIAKLADNLWCVDGSLSRMPIGRRMTAIKLADGALLIHSAIELDEASMAALEAWGKPTYLVVPNGFHRLAAPAYARRYPDITVLCPASQAKKVGQVVTTHGSLDEPPDPLAADSTLSIEMLDGCHAREAVLAVKSGDDVSLVFNDAMFNLPARLPGFSGFMTKLMGSTGGPKVTRLGRWLLVADRAAFAAHFRRLAERPGLRRVIMSHGAIIDDDPAAALRRVADGLAP